MDIIRQAETMIDLLASDHTEEDDIYQIFHANDKKEYASFYNALERAVAEKKTLDTSALETLYEKIAGYSEIKKLMPEDLIPGYSPMWLAAKTLENDPVVLAKLKNTLDTDTVSGIDGYRKGVQGAVETGSAKFSWIDRILAGAVTEKKESLTMSRLDRIYTHKTWGKLGVVLVLRTGSGPGNRCDPSDNAAAHVDHGEDIRARAC